VYLEACLRFPWMGGLGFLCMLVVLVYLEAFGTFFFVYNTLTYQKKKKKKKEKNDIENKKTRKEAINKKRQHHKFLVHFNIKT
jgi:Flp pilus assembly protein TadB